MIGDVYYDPNKPIASYDEFTCDQTLALLRASYGSKNVYLVEEGEDYILVEADSILKKKEKKFSSFI